MAHKPTIQDLRQRIGEIEARSAERAFDFDDRAQPSPAIDSPDCAEASTRTRKQRRGNNKDACDSSEAAFSKIVAILNVADKSEKALRDRLARDGFIPEAIEEALQRAKAYGFVDDMRYAQLLVRSRVAQGKGSCSIVRDLAANGISAEDLAGWPDDYAISYDEELDRALEVLARKPPHSKNPREAAFRKLMQRGFPTQVSSAAARQWYQGTVVS